jgi:OOP family OmpA-OmpF porin
MARRLSVQSIGVFFCMILFFGVTFAGDQEGMFSITPHVGGFIFDESQPLEHGFTLGAGAGYNFTRNWTAEFVFDAINTQMDPGGMDATGYLYRVEGLYRFRAEKKLVPYLAVGVGWLKIDSYSGIMDTSFITNYGGGLKYFITDRIGLRGDVRHLIVEDRFHKNMLVTLGVDFLFGKKKEPVAAPAPPPPPPPADKDSDGDGVFDRLDKCPDTPRGVKVNSDGCPLDTDGDGVYDYLDKCPDTPRGVKVNSDGCPLDTDGDGVYDYLDKCPDTPRGVKVNSDGCPLDTDGDGVYDYLDKCPNTPRGVKVNSTGCPLDTDGDGVYDYLDKCPDTPRDLKVDANGCPILMKDKVTISLDIQFDTDKSDIKPQYNGRLKEVADFMIKYPATTAVIEGHTDSVGSEAYNQKLSQRRADSARDYLIKNLSVSANRLTAKGFGEGQPVASNDTEEGRSKNRRIQAVFSAETQYYEKK